jgi:replicative DNA helicase
MVSSELKDKVPPFNDEAERATLGALFQDSEAIGDVLRYLRGEDFYRSAHEKIFKAIINLFNQSEAVDLITVTEELKRESALEACGGASYLSDLTSAVPTAANVEYYAKIVQGCSIRRNLLKIAREIIAEAHDDSKDSRIIIEAAERKIFEVTDKQQSESFISAREIIPDTVSAIEKLYHKDNPYTGIPSGYADLDKYTFGFQNSEFIVIGARPSVGKTAFALSMAANMTIRNKVPVGFFTLEMSRLAIMQRLVGSEARINSEKLRSGMLKPSDFHNLTEAASLIYEAPLYIQDTSDIRLLDLRAQARRAKSQFGIEIIFVDYLTLVRPENSEIPRHEQIAEISRSLKSLARELEIPVVALSQVRRETEGKHPTLADLRESGSIEQDADVVIFLHRERIDQSGEGGKAAPAVMRTEVIVAKQRNGPIGTVELAFIPQYTRFEELTRETP